MLLAEPEGRSAEHVGSLLQVDRNPALTERRAVQSRLPLLGEVGLFERDGLVAQDALRDAFGRLAVTRVAHRNRLVRLLGDRDLLRPLVIPVIRDVREHLAANDDPLHGHAVDHVPPDNACRPRLKRPPVLLPQRRQLLVPCVALVEQILLDHTSEARDLMNEVSLRLVPDLALSVERGAFSCLQFNEGATPVSAEDDMEDRPVSCRRECAVEDADAFGSLPRRDDEEPNESHDPRGHRELERERAPSWTRIAENFLPRGGTRGLGHESVEGFLDVGHRWASFSELRSAL